MATAARGKLRGAAPAVLIKDFKVTEKGVVSIDAAQALKTPEVKRQLKAIEKIRMAIDAAMAK